MLGWSTRGAFTIVAFKDALHIFSPALSVYSLLARVVKNGIKAKRIALLLVVDYSRVFLFFLKDLYRLAAVKLLFIQRILKSTTHFYPWCRIDLDHIRRKVCCWSTSYADPDSVLDHFLQAAPFCYTFLSLRLQQMTPFPFLGSCLARPGLNGEFYSNGTTVGDCEVREQQTNSSTTALVLPKYLLLWTPAYCKWNWRAIDFRIDGITTTALYITIFEVLSSKAVPVIWKDQQLSGWGRQTKIELPNRGLDT